ncbi:GNAT family N-acetyltransferase [Aquimarina algiphila]|uniref:GNAT family N-acetyltransferase n=1 Tax=Aquimarina algiphila TaxID=2047982 RepID=UPI00232FA7CE|nr:GNAT family N-acetyltransferase [Aquimarina algiphila]
MLDQLYFKVATISDLPAMQNVGTQLFDLPIKINRAKEFLNDPRHHLILAYYKKEIIAMASAFHYIHPDKNPSLFINEVGVIEAYQNMGIGRKITAYLCEYAKQLDCHEACVATEHSNVAARKTYYAAGGIEDKDPIVVFNFDLDKNQSS